MKTTKPTNNTLFEILSALRFKEFCSVKFPTFLEFTKNIDVGDWRDAKSKMIVRKDFDFYRVLYKGGVISKEEFEEYANELLSRLPENVEIKENRYVLTYKNRTVYVDTALSIAGKFFFNVDDELWKKVEPLFLATIGYGLDISEDDIRAYIQLLNHIQTKPIKTAKEMINKLSLNDEIEKIGNILMMASDEEMIAKRLENYVLDIVDRIVRKERLDTNVELLKQLINIK
jgi:hypothetical protein